jgi:hypothetical protein
MRTITSHRGWWVALQVLICCKVLITVKFILLWLLQLLCPYLSLLIRYLGDSL